MIFDLKKSQLNHLPIERNNNHYAISNLKSKIYQNIFDLHRLFIGFFNLTFFATVFNMPRFLSSRKIKCFIKNHSARLSVAI